MRNIKKLFSAVLISALFLNILPLASAGSYISDIATPSNLILYSKPCPIEVRNFAINNFPVFLSESIMNGTLSIESESNSSSISLGSPFTITSNSVETDVFYFPIFSGASILGTFRVYLDGNKYVGIMSQFLSDELTALIGETSISSPAHLYFDRDNLMMKKEGNHQLLINSPIGDSPTNIDVQSDGLVVTSLNEDLQVISSNSLPSFNEPVSDNTSLSTPTSPKYLSLNIIETQGSNSWCYAYCASTIIRFVKNYSDAPVAEGFMALALGRNPSPSDSLNATQVINTAVGYYDLYPSYTATPDISQSVSDLYNDVPVFLRCSDSAGGHHAIVLRGYNPTSVTYSIWNPWHSYYETMSENLTYITGNRTFIWVGTINGWWDPLG